MSFPILFMQLCYLHVTITQYDSTTLSQVFHQGKEKDTNSIQLIFGDSQNRSSQTFCPLLYPYVSFKKSLMLFKKWKMKSKYILRLKEGFSQHF